jgi:DNA-binding PadR family transcriptional regulator
MKTDEHVWPSRKELEVLKVLQAERQGAYGLDIVSKSEGLVGRTTIYILLGRLEEKGFVRQKKTEDFHPGRPRRIYVITAEGARALAGVLVAREIRTTRLVRFSRLTRRNDQRGAYILAPPRPFPAIATPPLWRRRTVRPLALTP